MKLLPVLLIPLSLALVSPGLAQPVADPIAPARDLSLQPIPAELLQKFIAVTAINSCMLLQEKIDYRTVLKTGLSSVSGIVYTDYASRISGINGDKPLENAQLAAGIGLDLSIQISGRCEKLVPQEDLKKLREFIQTNTPKK